MPTAGRSRSSLTWVSAASICITWAATSRNGSKRSGARCCRTFTDVDPTAIVAGIVRELMALRKPDRAAAEKRYLKSDLVFLGVGVPGIRTTAKHAYHEHPALNRTSVLAVVTELWAEPVHERRMAAIEILGLYRDRLQPPDLGLIERLIRESKTWAYVDSFAGRDRGAARGAIPRSPPRPGSLVHRPRLLDSPVSPAGSPAFGQTGR